MKNSYRHIYQAFLSGFLILLFFTINADAASPASFFIPSGISSTLDEIKSLIISINNFISGIISFTRMIGFSTFVFFLFVLLISSGLSAIGIPRGWISFLMSLAVADFLWITWKEAFKPETLGYLKEIIKSNLIIMVPVFLFALLKWGVPILYRKTKRWIIAVLARKKTGITREESLRLSDDFLQASHDFQKALTHDIFSTGDEKRLSLSPETVNNSKKLREILSRIEEKE